MKTVSPFKSFRIYNLTYWLALLFFFFIFSFFCLFLLHVILPQFSDQKYINNKNAFQGMRTARLLTVSQHALGVSAQGRCLPKGCLSRGDVYLGVCIPAYNETPPPRGQTDTCVNITFALFAGGNKKAIQSNANRPACRQFVLHSICLNMFGAGAVQ